MTGPLRDVFADTGYWIALVVRQDQHHDQAQQWSLRVTGRMTTTTAVLLEPPTRSRVRLGARMPYE